jgi:hypothetical protein
MPLDFAIVPRLRRSVLVVSYALLNAIFELHGGLSRGSLIVHKLLELLCRCGARTRAALTIRDVRHRRLSANLPSRPIARFEVSP